MYKRLPLLFVLFFGIPTTVQAQDVTEKAQKYVSRNLGYIHAQIAVCHASLDELIERGKQKQNYDETAVVLGMSLEDVTRFFKANENALSESCKALEYKARFFGFENVDHNQYCKQLNDFFGAQTKIIHDSKTGSDDVKSSLVEANNHFNEIGRAVCSVMDDAQPKLAEYEPEFKTEVQKQLGRAENSGPSIDAFETLYDSAIEAQESCMKALHDRAVEDKKCVDTCGTYRGFSEDLLAIAKQMSLPEKTTAFVKRFADGAHEDTKSLQSACAKDQSTY